jgi:hypothetical protein
MAFPYREGLMFEIALLQKGSQPLAFTTALKRPPRLTHQILHPQAYITGEKSAPVRIPDLRPVLGEWARVQDAGIVGELDTRVLIHQFGSKWRAKQLAKSWRGGSYMTVARSPEGEPATTNDIALLYVSRWQSADAAARFAKFYAEAAGKRYRRAQAVVDWRPPLIDGRAPIAAVQIATEEGPVIVEQWPGNLVIVAEGFDAEASAQVRNAVLTAAPGTRASAAQSDLTLRLANLPELGALRDAVHANAARAVVELAREIAQE